MGEYQGWKEYSIYYTIRILIAQELNVWDVWFYSKVVDGIRHYKLDRGVFKVYEVTIKYYTQFALWLELYLMGK